MICSFSQKHLRCLGSNRAACELSCMDLCGRCGCMQGMGWKWMGRRPGGQRWMRGRGCEGKGGNGWVEGPVGISQHGCADVRGRAQTCLRYMDARDMVEMDSAPLVSRGEKRHCDHRFRILRSRPKVVTQTSFVEVWLCPSDPPSIGSMGSMGSTNLRFGAAG